MKCRRAINKTGFKTMPETIVKFYSLGELWKNLPNLPGSRKYVAGGTDMMPVFNRGAEKTGCWIDISDIRELKAVKENGKEVFIGAGVKISELESNPSVKKHVSSLIRCVPFFASPSLRNMATLGGNLANASPCADGVCALAASRARVLLNLKGRRRILPVLSVLKGPKKTSLKKDEIVEGFLVPKWTHKAVFFKLMPRRLFGISKASLCLCAQVRKGQLADLEIALASVAPVVRSSRKTGSFLKNKELNAGVLKKARELIKTEISPITDIRSEADYRREMTAVFLERALKSVVCSVNDTNFQV